MAVSQHQAVGLEFFSYLFGNDEGYLCIATIAQPYKRDTFQEKFFEWPGKCDQMLEYIEKVTPTHNVYFCVNVLSQAKRVKENAIPQNLVWADLDTCRPDQVEIPPQCVIESSPKRYHAIWRLDQKLDPPQAEEYSRRIAYAYHDQGADKSGWDITQLLRVPGTYNFKYGVEDSANVTLSAKFEKLLPADVFEILPKSDDAPLEEITGIGIPTELPDVTAVVYAYQDALKQTAFARYYGTEPATDWSKSLWRLINTCFEVGMSAPEAFAVVKTSACNKYERDGRPESHLWREILKAEIQHKDFQTVMADNRVLTMPQLLTAKELKLVGNTIIHEYKEWAVSATDAVEEFHELSCAILLSALMSAGLRIHSNLPSPLNTNLWGLILGDSTLTRKTTSMQMAMDFLSEIDRELVVASDGSAEGLLSALSLRPKMVSVYYRDEITGFLDAIHKKEYLSSMPEILTHLYDVPKYYPRRLRKETITVVEPIFIFFGGGIKDRAFSLIEDQMFLSGFMPRFLVVSGSTDLARVRRTGPPQPVNLQKRESLRTTFAALYNIYSQTDIQVAVGDPQNPQMVSLNRTVDVYLDDQAWERAAQIEDQMMAAAFDAPESSKALPSFQRMYFSMLKLAALLCASRKEPSPDVSLTVELIDIINSAYFIQRWGVHYVDLVKNSGHTRDETAVQAVYRTVERHPGILRGVVMQRHHLSARTMTDIQNTLEQRMMIQTETKGRGMKLWPIGQ